jgi:cell shape-determining protein MreC
MEREAIVIVGASGFSMANPALRQADAFLRLLAAYKELRERVKELEAERDRLRKLLSEISAQADER